MIFQGDDSLNVQNVDLYSASYSNRTSINELMRKNNKVDILRVVGNFHKNSDTMKSCLSFNIARHTLVTLDASYPLMTKVQLFYLKCFNK